MRFDPKLLSDIEPQTGVHLEAKLARLVMDYLDYPKMRRDYVRMQPSIEIDLSEAWREYLQENPPPESEAQKEKFYAFRQMAGWVLFGLEHWLEIDFRYRKETIGTGGHWFGTDPASSCKIKTDHDNSKYRNFNNNDELEIDEQLVTLDVDSQSLDTQNRIFYLTVNPASTPTPTPTPNWNFQAKYWVGESPLGAPPWVHREYQGHAKCLVAYLRPARFETTLTPGTPPSEDIKEPSPQFNLQLWRALNDPSSPPGNVPEQENQWLLEKTLCTQYNHPVTGYYLRYPRTAAEDDLWIGIDCDMFEGNTGSNYEYFVISLDKLEAKLHLLSKYYADDQATQIAYPSIESDLPALSSIFEEDTTLYKEKEDYFIAGKAIVAGDDLPATGEHRFNVPLSYVEPENEHTVQLNDFILCIRPKPHE